MKNLMKGIGAALGYIGIYLLIAFLVILTFGIVIGIQAAQAGLSYQDMINKISDAAYRNAMTYNVIAGIVTLICFLLLIKLRKKSVRERLDLIPVPWKKLWPIIPLGFTLNFFIEYAVGFLPIPERVMAEYSAASSPLTDISVPVVVSAVVMAPLLEEILFRGLVLKSLHRGMPLPLALVLQAILFGLLHGQILWMSYAAVLGLVLGHLKVRYKSLYAAMLLHFSINGSNYIVMPLENAIENSVLLKAGLFILSAVLTVFFTRMIFKRTEPVIELAIEDVPVSLPFSEL